MSRGALGWFYSRLRTEMKIPSIRFYDPATMGKYTDPENYIDGVDCMVMMVKVEPDGSTLDVYMGKGQITELACAVSLDIPVFVYPVGCQDNKDSLWAIDDVHMPGSPNNNDWTHYQKIALYKANALRISYLGALQKQDPRESNVPADNKPFDRHDVDRINAAACYAEVDRELIKNYTEEHSTEHMKPNTILLAMHW